jgi:hypothetical protein
MVGVILSVGYRQGCPLETVDCLYLGYSLVSFSNGLMNFKVAPLVVRQHESILCQS